MQATVNVVELELYANATLKLAIRYSPEEALKFLKDSKSLELSFSGGVKHPTKAPMIAFEMGFLDIWDVVEVVSEYVESGEGGIGSLSLFDPVSELGRPDLFIDLAGRKVREKVW